MATVCWLLLLVTMMAETARAVDVVDVDAATNITESVESETSETLDIQSTTKTTTRHQMVTEQTTKRPSKQAETLESTDEGDGASQGSRDPTSQPRDCYELLTVGSKKSSGVYKIYVGLPNRKLTPVKVYCDMNTDGGGWTVLIRRKDGTVGFFRKWNDYKEGFGHADGEYWLGNDNIHQLTTTVRQKLRVELEDFEGNKTYAQYNDFLVGSEEEQYKLLMIGTYNGTAGDSLSFQIGSKFHTVDKDTTYRKRKCAGAFHGGWWYRDWHCLRCQLTGFYLFGPVSKSMYWRGIMWYHWKRNTYSLKAAEMKIRPFYA